ncbi:hypothetical protein [Hymenobacter sp. APR13]|uniref:hypothetical protein n=1 Tax=Hymenobacter sp. APR13 TaxID=1356852 RepID=UPI0004E074F4|nr:hypothetical protein [Hymenobacter sp. APR13]AII50420.1 hypothetical protein N008_00285 [Hymenobacter sp. APR13]
MLHLFCVDASVGNLNCTSRQAPRRSAKSSGAVLRYTIQASTRVAFDQARQAAKASIVVDKAGVTADKKGVLLKLNTGKTRFFQNKLTPQNEDEVAEFRYKGRIPALKKYVVAGMFWEAGRVFLVDERSGQTDTIWSEPICAPDFKLMAALNEGLVFEDDLNGVQVYSSAGGRIRKMFAINQQKWVPINLVWNGNKRFILRVMSAEEAMAQSAQHKPNDTKYRYLQVIIKDL